MLIFFMILCCKGGLDFIFLFLFLFYINDLFTFLSSFSDSIDDTGGLVWQLTLALLIGSLSFLSPFFSLLSLSFSDQIIQNL